MPRKYPKGTKKSEHFRRSTTRKDGTPVKGSHVKPGSPKDISEKKSVYQRFMDERKKKAKEIREEKKKQRKDGTKLDKMLYDGIDHTEKELGTVSDKIDDSTISIDTMEDEFLDIKKQEKISKTSFKKAQKIAKDKMKAQKKEMKKAKKGEL